MTLYNVQPGETYAVNITLINCGLGLTIEFHFQAEGIIMIMCIVHHVSHLI